MKTITFAGANTNSTTLFIKTQYIYLSLVFVCCVCTASCLWNISLVTCAIHKFSNARDGVGAGAVAERNLQVECRGHNSNDNGIYLFCLSPCANSWLTLAHSLACVRTLFIIQCMVFFRATMQIALMFDWIENLIPSTSNRK